jgi:release factor glutamine methyltransferase
VVNDFDACRATSTADLLTDLTSYLRKADVSEPEVKAEQLLAHHLGCRRLELKLRGRDPVAAEALAKVAKHARRLAAGEPLQYVLGCVEFMGHEFRTDYRALIPRPETEELVETILNWRALREIESPLVVDVGTGSGCVVISLAMAWPRARLIACDISGEALALARENAGRHGVAERIAFVRCDLLSEVGSVGADAVIANLPYVRSAEWAQLPREIRDHEPRDALDGGKDGLALISRLVPEALRVLKSNGWLFLEIGEDQGAGVSDLMRQARFVEIEVWNDLSGRPRFVRGRKP